MKVVVDANVFAAFYRAELGHQLGEVTADPAPLFRSDPSLHQIVLDEGGHIEAEWLATVDPDWCRSWIGGALIEGRVELKPSKSDVSLKGLLQQHGFPLVGSKDIWYLRLLHNLIGKWSAAFVSEDLDFYEPGKKCGIFGVDRLKFLREGSGRLRKDLGRKFKLDICCIEVLISDRLR